MNPIVPQTVEYRPQQQQQQLPEERLPSVPDTATSPNKRNEVVAAAPGDQKPATASALIGSVPPPTPLPAKMATSSAKGAYKTKRIFKVIIIGDAGVGKTCLSYRFCNGRFPGATEATIGVDFRERSLVVNDELIRVQLWDTAGQERYRQSIVAHYYRNVNAVVFVYDVNSPASFKSLPAWINECKVHALSSGDDHTPHILIGNKCDLPVQSPSERVKTDQAQIFADENDMALFETSALSDSEADHVESIFMTLVHKLRQSKPMHVQSSEERSQREQQQKILLLKADEAAKLKGQQEEEEGGLCC